MMNKIFTYLSVFFIFTSVSFADKNMMIGSKGKLSEVDRTIKVKMYDNYYEPKSFSIKKGETIKFEVVNAGNLVHEFNIANAMMHKKHQPEMERMVENERMHLMTFIHIAKPTFIERIVIMIAQFIFIITYAIIYLVSQRTAHRIVGYFEEEAVRSYTEYLHELETGKIKDQPAPEVAINYWNLPLHATLKDVVKVIRDDEAGHRDVNHSFADVIDERKTKEKVNTTEKEIRTKENLEAKN